jgi:Tat protein translocase TatB subunit
MDILGVGFSELIFILIIAMMVFGPRRLPEIAAKAGKFVADLRSMSQGLMAEWQREITVAGRLEELEQARQDIQAIKQDLSQTKQELNTAKKRCGDRSKTEYSGH